MKTRSSKQAWQEFQGLSEADLRERLKAAKAELFHLRFQLAIRQLENTAQIGEVRNRIALIQTALSDRRRAAVGGTV